MPRVDRAASVSERLRRRRLHHRSLTVAPRRASVAALMLAACLAAGADLARAQDGDRFEPVPLRSRITRVQPMTGIVLWTTSEHNKTKEIQLEYSYMKYSDIVKERGRYDWRVMDRLLERVAARKHQAIVRFYYVYPGNPTTVPNYLKALPDYHETRGQSEGKPTGFPDWSHRACRSSRSSSTRGWPSATTTTRGWRSSRRASASGPSTTSIPGRE